MAVKVADQLQKRCQRYWEMEDVGGTYERCVLTVTMWLKGSWSCERE